MKKEDLLQEEIEKVLLDIDFISQYQRLSDSFTNSDLQFQYTNEQVLVISKKFGVNLQLFGGDQYFSEFEKVEGFEFRIGMTIKFNTIEFDLTVKNDLQNITSGGSFGLIAQLLTNWETRVKKPGFNSYADMKRLIEEGLSIYFVIKKAVVEKLRY